MDQSICSAIMRTDSQVPIWPHMPVTPALREQRQAAPVSSQASCLAEAASFTLGNYLRQQHLWSAVGISLWLPYARHILLHTYVHVTPLHHTTHNKQ